MEVLFINYFGNCDNLDSLTLKIDVIVGLHDRLRVQPSLLILVYSGSVKPSCHARVPLMSNGGLFPGISFPRTCARASTTKVPWSQLV